MSIEIKKPAIDIGIVARDIDAMLSFYGEVIGLGTLLIHTIPKFLKV